MYMTPTLISDADFASPAAAPLSVAATVLSAALLSDALSADVLSAVPFEPHPASMETVSPIVNNTLNAFFIFFILLYHYLIEIHE